MAPRFAIVPAQWLAPESPLTRSERLVLAVLSQYANTTTGECWPSVSLIAACAKQSEPTVRTAIKGLVKAGAVKATQRREGGFNRTNLYTIMGYDMVDGVGKPFTHVGKPFAQGGKTGVVSVGKPFDPNVVSEQRTERPQGKPIEPGGSSVSGEKCNSVEPEPSIAKPEDVAEIRASLNEQFEKSGARRDSKRN